MSQLPPFPEQEIKPIPPVPEYPHSLLNQKYMMPPERIREVYDDGNVIGIEASLLIPLYHGSPLSMIDTITARYDGVEFVNDPMKFTVNGHTYTFAEMKTMSTLYWEYGEYAQLFIPIPGGVGLGVHKLEVGFLFNSGVAGMRFPSWVSATINFIEN